MHNMRTNANVDAQGPYNIELPRPAEAAAAAAAAALSVLGE